MAIRSRLPFHRALEPHPFSLRHLPGAEAGRSAAARPRPLPHGAQGKRAGAGAGGKRPAASASAAAPVPARGWTWPARGPLIRGFGKGDRGGIDIAGQRGQPVVAARNGRVVYTGSGLVGYGRLVIIKHGERLLTAYAHNDRVVVKEGQTVRAGQKIAEMGEHRRRTGQAAFRGPPGRKAAEPAEVSSPAELSRRVARGGGGRDRAGAAWGRAESSSGGVPPVRSEAGPATTSRLSDASTLNVRHAAAVVHDLDAEAALHEGTKELRCRECLAGAGSEENHLGFVREDLPEVLLVEIIREQRRPGGDRAVRADDDAVVNDPALRSRNNPDRRR